MSHVICHMSHVMCRMSCVTCNLRTKWWSLLVEGLLSAEPSPSSFTDCRTALKLMRAPSADSIPKKYPTENCKLRQYTQALPRWKLPTPVLNLIRKQARRLSPFSTLFLMMMGTTYRSLQPMMFFLAILNVAGCTFYFPLKVMSCGRFHLSVFCCQEPS